MFIYPLQFRNGIKTKKFRSNDNGNASNNNTYGAENIEVTSDAYWLIRKLNQISF